MPKFILLLIFYKNKRIKRYHIKGIGCPLLILIDSEHSSQRAKRVANNVSSYGRDMVQNGLGFMHSVSLKSHGPVLLSMKLLPYPGNQSCFPSALDKLNKTALRRMVPAVTSLAN